MRDKPAYRAYTIHNVHELAGRGLISAEQCFELEVLGAVFPFKVSNYVIDQLIDWKTGVDDPIFRLTFPHRQMLSDEQFAEIAMLVRKEAPRSGIKKAASDIQMQLNPHPAHQIEHNVPVVDGQRLKGVQHKYQETVLYFPSQGQTCHAYCTFCFRWAQFIGDMDLRFAAPNPDELIKYLTKHRSVTNLLMTGGDPLVMSAKVMRRHVDPILAGDLPNLTTIRFGTKSLSYWPYRFTDDPDAEEVLDVFRTIVSSGRHCAVMAHFNHPNELSTPAVKEAIARIRDTGAEIRCQSPLIRHVNDSANVWVDLWREETRLGCIPYYMFLARDTGACNYFHIPLSRALEIFRGAYASVGGLCRTVRGPAMSTDPGKVQILGTTHLGDERVFVLRFLQARNPRWVGRPFFARFDPEATWLTDLRPAGGAEHFFFEKGVGREWLLPWEEGENRHHQLIARGLRRIRSGKHVPHGPWQRGETVRPGNHRG